MDLTFVIDSKQGGSSHKKKMWKFIKNVLSYIDLNNGNVRVRFVHDCYAIPGFHLNGYTQRSSLLDAIDNMRVRHKTTAELLHTLTRQMTEGGGGDGDGGGLAGIDGTNELDNAIIQRRQVGVLITDGPSGDMEATLREAQNARLGHGIELYGIGVTDKVSVTELQAIVSCPIEKHLQLVPTHRKLRTAHKMLARQLCEGRHVD